jgi:anti-sigma factor RsiW
MSVSSDEADRLIAAALRDHARIPAPPALRAKLERRYLGKRRTWIAPAISGAVCAVLAAAIVLVIVRPAPHQLDVAEEAVGDHQRVLDSRGLGVISTDQHTVKPWFAGKLDFMPQVAFLGDDDFPLKGGDTAVFLGHKAAAFIYGRRLHAITLFVFEATDVPTAESTIRGFHVMTWQAGELGFALVSDVNWGDLRALRQRL